MLLRRVEKFLRATGMSRTEFGRRAARDPRFVADLHKGREPRPAMEARVDRFITTYQESPHAR